MENLLRNPGFEEPWGNERNHQALVIPTYGEPFVKESGNIFTPPGWLTWFYHEPGEWDQPEVKLMAAAQYDERVFSGEQAVCMFSFARRHDGGFLQQVELQPGRVVTVFLRSTLLWKFRHGDTYWDEVALVRDGSYLTLTAWAHGWSNHDGAGFPHPNDPAWSEGVGFGPAAFGEADAPALNGDPQNDALGNITFRLGVDPLGGRNPYAESVYWGAGMCIYNAYAEARCLTVRVAGLLGQPREQYARTYVLLPPDAGEDWAAAAVKGGWKFRFTIGGSADDAGIGDLERRRVVAVNPQKWTDDLAAFFAEHYPGVVYVPVKAESPLELVQVIAGVGEFETEE
jgi:hypothetical protein